MLLFLFSLFLWVLVGEDRRGQRDIILPIVNKGLHLLAGQWLCIS